MLHNELAPSETMADKDENQSDDDNNEHQVNQPLRSHEEFEKVNSNVEKAALKLKLPRLHTFFSGVSFKVCK